MKAHTSSSALRFTFIVILLLGISTASAQTTGAVRGQVTDPGGIPLQDAIISIEGQAKRTTSDRTGTFRLTEIAPGEYNLSASYVGFDVVVETVTVTAGSTAIVKFTMSEGEEVFELEDYTVTSNQGDAMEAALSQQRAAENITNVIASDAIGNFPDANAAEALQRIPGLSIENQRGEGRFLIARGAAPNYNSITMDGSSVLSSERDGRTVSLDVFPAEQISRIEVTKAITPDLPGDSIGASINLVTKRAFDFGKRNINANLFSSYNDLAEDFGYRTGASYSEILGKDEEWGLQLSAQVNNRVGEEHNNETPTARYRELDLDGQNYVIADRLLQTDVEIERLRRTISGTLEKRNGSNAYYFVRATMNRFTEDNDRPLHQINFGTNQFSDPITDEDGRLISVSNSRLTGRRQTTTRTFEDTYRSLAAGGEIFGDNSKLTFQLSYSLAQNTQDSVRGEFNTVRLNDPFTIDLSDPRFPKLDPVARDYINDPENFIFSNARVNDRDVDHGEWAAKIDYEDFTTMGRIPFTWKVGAQARLGNMDSFENEINHRGFDDGTITDLRMTDERVGYYQVAPDFLDGRYDFGPSPRDAAFTTFFLENPDFFGVPVENVEEYEADEDVYAAYAMGTWQWTRLTLLAGVRVEHTRISFDGGTIVDDRPDEVGDFDPSGSYTDLLPSVHLRYQLTEPMILRFAWSNSLARPEFDRMAPFETISVDALTGDIFIRRGNPALEAVESMNWDLMLEYFLKHGGLISAGLFYKQIDGPIYRSTLSEDVDDITITIESFYNAGKATVLGIELNYQAQFKFLPGIWDGLGVMVNATFTNSDVDVPQRPGEEFPLFRQSDAIGNLAIFYEKYGWNIRLAYNWRSRFLRELGNSPILDIYEDDFSRIDFQLGYKINRHWKIAFEATNLLDEAEYLTSGGPRLPSFYGLTGRTFSLGVHWNY